MDHPTALSQTLLSFVSLGKLVPWAELYDMIGRTMYTNK